MKSFMVFAMICMANPTTHKVDCVNYWEPKEPMYTREDCDMRAKQLAMEVEKNLINNGIQVLEHISWCVEKKGELT